MRKVTMLVCDKTDTLTEEKSKLIRVHAAFDANEEKLLLSAASLEKKAAGLLGVPDPIKESPKEAIKLFNTSV